MKNTMQKLLDMTCEKLDQISNAKELNATLVKDLDLLIDIKKDILEIQAMEEYANNEYEGEYSQRGMNGNSYAMKPFYTYNRSYGYPMASERYYQDMMDGAYSRSDGMNGSSYNNYNMGNGYSREGSKDEMRNHLQQMMQKAGSQEEREMVQRFMDEVDHMR